jgi:hypothetical protein
VAGGRALQVFHAIALVIGIIAFVVLLERMGVAGLYRVIGGIGGWFLVIAAIDLVSVMCDAGAVYYFASANAEVSYWRVFAAQASGLAINRLTPGNAMGEPVKVTMLVEHVPQRVAISAIVMFNVATTLIAIAAIVIGVPITLLVVDLPGRLPLLVWISTGVLVVVAVAQIILVRRGALGTLITGARRLGLSADRARRWQTRIAGVDAHLQNLGAPGSRRGFVFVIGSRLLNQAGTVVLLIASGIPLSVPLVAAMLSVGILVTWMSNIVPLGMGIADGTNYALYGALGATGAQGLDFTMINRARTFVLALMGLTVMLIANVIDRLRGRRSTPSV